MEHIQGAIGFALLFLVLTITGMSIVIFLLYKGLEVIEWLLESGFWILVVVAIVIYLGLPHHYV